MDRRIQPGRDSRRIYPEMLTAPPIPAPPNLVRIRQASEARPALTERNIRDWAASGVISSWKVGKFRLVDLDELDRLIARGYKAGGAA